MSIDNRAIERIEITMVDGTIHCFGRPVDGLPNVLETLYSDILDGDAGMVEIPEDFIEREPWEEGGATRWLNLQNMLYMDVWRADEPRLKAS